ncbi:MAG TPA: glycerate kinase [Candidatus Deferrimicrobiaceae bacterium]|nr:glycerate kinase [Candidatus Deferrimicrobiaceae bacterium]
MPRALDVVIAPDSFKGSLTSVEVAQALADGWRRARPDDRVELAPLADGGQGTIVAIAAAGGWEWRETEVHGPDFAPVRATWLISPDGRSAVIEMAAASGLSLIPVGQRRTTEFTSMGTGELIRAALDAGVREITLGIGGSATSDGAAGILTVLGAIFRGADGAPLAEPPNPPVAIALAQVASVDLSGLDPRLAEVELRIACDVTNPLLGPDGAAAVYGPQKGATPDDVEALDGALSVYGAALEAATGRRERATPGAGAAGGVGFGLLCLSDHFRKVELVPGVDVVMAAADLEGKLARADLVITGEGRIDAQTAFGKTALGVARAAKAAGVPCIAVGGGVEPGGIEALADLAVVVPVVERPMSVEEAMAGGPGPLERCGERIARLVGLSLAT